MNNFITVFELYDLITNQRVSYHRTIKGAVTAMSEAVAKLAPALHSDYEGDTSFGYFELRYRVIQHKIKE